MVGRWFAESARQVVIVADSTKLGRRTLARLFDIDRVDLLITDSRAEPAVLDDLSAAGVDVRIAQVG